MNSGESSFKDGICINCLLPKNYPGVEFNEEHMCSICSDYKNNTDAIHQESLERKKQKELMEKFFDSVKKNNKGKYDCLVSFSGGKDSTYLVYLLKKKYQFNILTYTCDTGFLSDTAKTNIKTVIQKMNVDHLFYNPDKSFYKKLYTHYLKKGVEGNVGAVQSTCPQCFRATSLLAVKVATEKGIPMVISGLTPAQLGAVNYKVSKWQLISRFLYRKFFPDTIFNISLDKKERNLFGISLMHLHKIPPVIYPYSVLDYNVDEISREVVEHELIPPGNENPVSSNCLLNLLMMDIDSRKLGYNPYIKSASKLIRRGEWRRDNAIKTTEKLHEEIRNGCFEVKNIQEVLKLLELVSWYDEINRQMLDTLF